MQISRLHLFFYECLSLDYSNAEVTYIHIVWNIDVMLRRHRLKRKTPSVASSGTAYNRKVYTLYFFRQDFSRYHFGIRMFVMYFYTIDMEVIKSKIHVRHTITMNKEYIEQIVSPINYAR